MREACSFENQHCATECEWLDRQDECRSHVERLLECVLKEPEKLECSQEGGRIAIDSCPGGPAPFLPCALEVGSQTMGGFELAPNGACQSLDTLSVGSVVADHGDGQPRDGLQQLIANLSQPTASFAEASVQCNVKEGDGVFTLDVYLRQRGIAFWARGTVVDAAGQAEIGFEAEADGPAYSSDCSLSIRTLPSRPSLAISDRYVWADFTCAAFADVEDCEVAGTFLFENCSVIDQ